MSKIETEIELEVTDIGSQEDFIEYASDFLCEDDNSVVITQYENALKIINELEKLNGVHIIDTTDEDNEGYEPVVIRYVDEVFLITNLIDEEGFFKYITADYVLCEDLLDEDSLNAYIDAREELYLVDYDLEDEEEEGCHCDECCNCCGCDEEDDENAPYIELSDMIDEYTELIKDNECDEEAISFALMEYSLKLLQKFSVEKIED